MWWENFKTNFKLRVSILKSKFPNIFTTKRNKTNDSVNVAATAEKEFFHHVRGELNIINIVYEKKDYIGSVIRKSLTIRLLHLKEDVENYKKISSSKDLETLENHVELVYGSFASYCHDLEEWKI